MSKRTHRRGKLSVKCLCRCHTLQQQNHTRGHAHRTYGSMALLRVVPQSDPGSRTAHERITGRSKLPTPGATLRGSHCSVLQRNAGINGRVTSGRASERRVRRPVPENEARRGSRATIECVVSPAQSEGIRRGWRGKAAGCGKRAHEPFTACCHTRASHLMAIGAGTLPHRLRGAATPRR